MIEWKIKKEPTDYRDELRGRALWIPKGTKGERGKRVEYSGGEN